MSVSTADAPFTPVNLESNPPPKIAITPSLLVSWGILVLAALALSVGMIRFWLRGYDTFDRGLILVASAWLSWKLYPKLLRLPDKPWPFLGSALVLVGSLAFLPPWYVHSQLGPRPIILWWEAVALVLAVGGLILIRSGPALLKAVRFPLIFPLFALPLPGRVQTPFQAILQDCATTLAEYALPLFDIQTRRDGFMLQFPSGGGINVVEACSGLQLIRALLSIAALLGHLRGFGPVRGLLMMGMAFPVIVLVNALRVIVSGVLSEYYGVEAILGWKHDALGFAMLFVGLSMVLLLTKMLTRPGDGPAVLPVGSPAVPFRSGNAVAMIVLLAAATGGAAAYLAPGVSHTVAGEPPLNDIKTKLGEWSRPPIEPLLKATGLQPGVNGDFQFPEDVQATLGCYCGLHRYYNTSIGDQVAVWMPYWKSAQGVKDYHHPDVCWPNRGYEAVRKELIPVVTPDGRTIPVTFREFEQVNKNGGDPHRQILAYWTNEGRRIWTEADERRAASFAFPLVWIADRVARPKPENDSDDRFFVLIGGPVVGKPQKAQANLLKLAGLFADEVYRVCPWADPLGKTSP